MGLKAIAFFWLVTLALAANLAVAEDILPLPLSAQDFEAQIAQNESPQGLSRLDATREVDVDFFPIGALVSGQPTYSFLKVVDSLREARDYGVRTNREQYNLAHDSGRSVYPLEKQVKAIRYRGQLFVVDGHHKALTSLYYGATTVPVKVLADWSELKPGQFRRRMEDSGLTYRLDASGRPSSKFYRFREMRDDPNLYLARLVYLKVKVELSLGAMTIAPRFRAGEGNTLMPVIIKVNEDVPFLEFYVAQVLRNHGVLYKAKWGRDIPKRVLEQIRQILAYEKRRALAGKAEPEEIGSEMLKFALLVPKAVDLSSMSEADREEWFFKVVSEHFLKRSRLSRDCGGLLLASAKLPQFERQD